MQLYGVEPVESLASYNTVCSLELKLKLTFEAVADLQIMTNV
jgi:hypothetical protein